MEIKTRNEKERLLRETDMILAAEKLFLQKGFDSVSMDEIALEAHFTKRTLYQYFSSKEDLFFAVALKGFQLLSSYGQKGFTKGKTGFDKLRSGLYSYFLFSKEHPELFRLMNHVGSIRRKTVNSPKMTEFLKFDDQLFERVAKVIESGKRDGSIRKDIDALNGTFSIIFMATGFFRLLSETGKNFAEHFNQDMEAFVKYSLSMLIDSIRAK